MASRGYTNLLFHLNRPSTALPIAASLAHYLSSLPSPTPLTAITISSPFFTPPQAHSDLSALFTAFRHAVLLKHKSLVDDQSGNGLAMLFSRAVKVRLRDWVRDVLKGLEGGMGVLRLACAGGMLSGLGDLEGVGKLKAGSGEAGRGRVEDEVVVALAEVIELYVHEGRWEKEFQPVAEQGDVDALSLALILASQSLPLVPAPKLKALSLPILARHLTSTISSAFQSGSFLDLLPSSITPKDGYKIHISPTSSLPSTLTGILASPLYTSLASLSKLTARVLSTLIESKPSVGLVVSGRTLSVLEGLARDVERAWMVGGLDGVQDSDIELESRELTTQIWAILKTFLFTTIMISESILSTTVFVPPSSFPHPSTSTSTQTPTPKSLSLQTLQTLSYLSFVISQFGSVTTTSTPSTDFPELKKTFYIALDVLTSPEQEGYSGENGEAFVERLCAEDAQYGASVEATERRGRLGPAKKAFALACIEQLVPILNDDTLPMVFRTCFPYLSDPSHRETFESAHSVVLGIFAAHAQKIADAKLNATQRASSSELKSVNFVESLIPFYAGCLIENSVSGRLSTPQLRLAFSALVRSASSSAHASASSSADADALVLPQFCIDTLLSAINAPSTSSSSDGRDRLHSLHLALISTLPSLPLPLLLRTLDSIRSIVLSLPLHTDGDERRKELGEELFKEILERVGDREKEVTMRWWYDVRTELLGDGGRKREKGEATNISSRL